MTVKTTAEVVTLEASVRVLQVGNRQITQSVVRQLDFCSPWEMEPMGRVKLKDDVVAIGRHVETGDLRLANPHWCRLHTPPKPRVTQAETLVDARLVFEFDEGNPYRMKPTNWYVDPERVEVPELCPCCSGCSLTYMNCVSAENPWPPSLLTPRAGYSNGSTRLRWTWEEQSAETTGDVIETAGTVEVFARFGHEGSGNRFDARWVDGLPLIVMAGLR